jgi:hypothetical protein
MPPCSAAHTGATALPTAPGDVSRAAGIESVSCALDGDGAVCACGSGLVDATVQSAAATKNM